MKSELDSIIYTNTMEVLYSNCFLTNFIPLVNEELLQKREIFCVKLRKEKKA